MDVDSQKHLREAIQKRGKISFMIKIYAILNVR